jgi:hypothetical protein
MGNSHSEIPIPELFPSGEARLKPGTRHSHGVGGLDLAAVLLDRVRCGLAFFAG